MFCCCFFVMIFVIGLLSGTAGEEGVDGDVQVR